MKNNRLTHHQSDVLAKLILDPHQPVTYWRPVDRSQPAQAFVEIKLVDGKLPSDEEIQRQIAAALEDQAEVPVFLDSSKSSHLAPKSGSWTFLALVILLLIVSVSLNVVWRML